MNNASITKKKEILSLILKFNLIIGIYNLYLFSTGNSLFNLVIGSMNIGVWVFFREKYLKFSLTKKFTSDRKHRNSI